MISQKEFLAECMMLGYFSLKLVFLRLDLFIAAMSSPAFDRVLENYARLCVTIWHLNHARVPPLSRLSRFLGQSLCEAGGITWLCHINVKNIFAKPGVVEE